MLRRGLITYKREREREREREEEEEEEERNIETIGEEKKYKDGFRAHCSV